MIIQDQRYDPIGSYYLIDRPGSIFDDYRLQPFLHSYMVRWQNIMDDDSTMLFISLQFLRRLFVYLFENKYHLIKKSRILGHFYSILPFLFFFLDLIFIFVTTIKNERYLNKKPHRKNLSQQLDRQIRIT